MDFEWIAIALGDVARLAVAFALGLASKSVGLKPLVGFLATGLVLNLYGYVSGEVLQKLSDLGITLLLFVAGLKLSLRTFARPPDGWRQRHPDPEPEPSNRVDENGTSTGMEARSGRAKLVETGRRVLAVALIDPEDRGRAAPASRLGSAITITWTGARDQRRHGAS